MNFVRPVLLSSAVFLTLLGCAKEVPKLEAEAIIKQEEVTEKPSDFVVYDPRVDILFVIDNSGSMDRAQKEVARNTRLFATEISRATLLDYHIGVVSTDMSARDDVGSYGKLAGFPNFVDKNTTEAVRKLSSRMLLGTDGSATEMMFAPVRAALSEPNQSTYNKDFYRPGAFLAIIFITDAAEQSGISGKDFLSFLLTKKINPEKVLAYGAIRKFKEADSCLKGVEPLDEKLEQFLASVTNGAPVNGQDQPNVVSLCDKKFGRKLADFAKDIVQRTANSIRLKKTPDVTTIRVFYGNQEIPNTYGTGWTYETKSNSIILGGDIPWDTTQSNPQLRIDFKVIEEKLK
ncbi:hypothetical protein AZI86_18070 [Bdellovibrio bacteriovorus]|uniref:VWFA domain-containing protein n=1 Tax=Bdellovibrio bacteriovorus TaxID=959 RepID=A0A150WFM8_BDEBC|nr:vWA domain-containing protein [Bdellovibrio bacteriovorus]KYG61611.1 hypothetical protein AZI86_18070 [Bdellovibrio bacteriovorus]